MYRSIVGQRLLVPLTEEDKRLRATPLCLSSPLFHQSPFFCFVPSVNQQRQRSSFRFEHYLNTHITSLFAFLFFHNSLLLSNTLPISTFPTLHFQDAFSLLCSSHLCHHWRFWCPSQQRKEPRTPTFIWMHHLSSTTRTSCRHGKEPRCSSWTKLCHCLNVSRDPIRIENEVRRFLCDRELTTVLSPLSFQVPAWTGRCHFCLDGIDSQSRYPFHSFMSLMELIYAVSF